VDGTDVFLRDVTQALNDAINLPLEELRIKLYATSPWEPNEPYPYTFVKLIGSVYTSDKQMNGTRVTPETKGFIEAIKQPEAIPELKKRIAEVEEIMLERCDPSENIALCFFARTNAQGDHSPEPLRDAIKDALTLPLEELRTRRYADYSMTPDMWTFAEVIGSTFTGMPRLKNGNGVTSSTEGFLEAVKQPEVIPVLEKMLVDLEKAVLEYKELEEFRRQHKSVD
jgi:hypothetical protein